MATKKKAVKKPIAKNKNNTRKTAAKQVEKKSKEYIHPEQRKGEVFCTNISAKYVSNNTSHGNLMFQHSRMEEGAAGINFNKMNLKTKRLGEVAYDTNNQPILHYRPVFISKKEHDMLQEKASKYTDDLRSLKPFVHPELKRGEVYFTDITATTAHACLIIGKNFTAIAILESDSPVGTYLKKIPYKSKRLGILSYDTKGQLLPGFQPVFVKKSELNKKTAKTQKKAKVMKVARKKK